MLLEQLKTTLYNLELKRTDLLIKYDPNNESAWSYKTNLLIEAAKIADMNGEADKKAQYTRQAEVAQKRASELAEERRKKEEAEEKGKPFDPASVKGGTTIYQVQGSGAVIVAN